MPKKKDKPTPEPIGKEPKRVVVAIKLGAKTQASFNVFGLDLEDVVAAIRDCLTAKADKKK